MSSLERFALLRLHSHWEERINCELRHHHGIGVATLIFPGWAESLS